jgi:hypothetical protein
VKEEKGKEMQLLPEQPIHKYIIMVLSVLDPLTGSSNATERTVKPLD